MGKNVHVEKLDMRKLDSSVSSALRQKMTKLWEKGYDTIVLDMSEVIYIDSLGISSLISEQRRRPKGASIVFCSLGDYVRDVLEVTQLVRVFDIYTDAEAAKKALSGS